MFSIVYICFNWETPRHLKLYLCLWMKQPFQVLNKKSRVNHQRPWSLSLLTFCFFSVAPFFSPSLSFPPSHSFPLSFLHPSHTKRFPVPFTLGGPIQTGWPLGVRSCGGGGSWVGLALRRRSRLARIVAVERKKKSSQRVQRAKNRMT